MAEKAGKIWGEHGALKYRECAGDDLKVKVMKNPRLTNMCDPKSMPFDVKRIAWGGCKVLVEA
jgi:uncharacterized protein YbaA (DUF1428 family)